MESSILAQITSFLRKKKNRKVYLAVFFCLALVVTTVTVAALRMRGQAMNYTQKVLACPLEVHKHTEECWDEEGNLICGYADYVVHTHNSDCYNEDGELVCTLPEIKEHKHDETCYSKVLICGMEENPGHVHTEECYTAAQGELICGVEEHVHDETCYDETGELICGMEEHTHGETCYASEPVLICGMNEGDGAHTHTDSCYSEEEELICGKLEIHTHDDSCYETQADGSKRLICTKTVLEEHIHSDECFVTVELAPEEVEAQNAETAQESSCYDLSGNLTCGMEEHHHDDACYDENGALICGLPEHTHVQMSAQALKEKTYEDERVFIVARYGLDANIPDEAELRAYPVTAQSEPERYAQRVEEAMAESAQTAAAQTLVYNIGFYVGQTEIEPEAPVELTVQFLDESGIAAGDPIKVVHFGKAGAEVVTDTQVDADGNASFISDSFSDFMFISSARSVKTAWMIRPGEALYATGLMLMLLGVVVLMYKKHSRRAQGGG